MKSWDISNLQVGDKALLITSGWSRSMEIVAVEKVHKLHVIVGGTKYSKRDGHVAGAGSWGRTFLAPYDEKEWQDWNREQSEIKMRNRVRNFDWRACDINLIYQVYNILPDEVK